MKTHTLKTIGEHALAILVATLFGLLVGGLLSGCVSEDEEMGRPPKNPDELSRLLDLPGKDDSQMGQGVTIAPGQSRTILKNTGADDHDIRLVTAYLRASRVNVSVLAGEQSPLASRVVFRVLFGVGGGANQELFVTAKQGVAVTFAASSIEISATNDEVAGFGAPEVMATAALAYGPRAPTGCYDPASFDERAVILGPGLQIAFRPPPFTRALNLMLDAGVAGDASGTELLFIGGEPPASFVRVTGQVGQQFFENVPVPNQTSSVTITNTGAVATTYSLSWLLGI